MKNYSGKLNKITGLILGAIAECKDEIAKIVMHPVTFDEFSFEINGEEVTYSNGAFFIGIPIETADFYPRDTIVLFEKFGKDVCTIEIETGE